MPEKTSNLLKASFFAIVVITCIVSLLTGRADGQWYPYIGIVLGGALTIAYLKRFFEK